jgi:hypothetical protein
VNSEYGIRIAVEMQTINTGVVVFGARMGPGMMLMVVKLVVVLVPFDSI